MVVQLFRVLKLVLKGMRAMEGGAWVFGRSVFEAVLMSDGSYGVSEMVRRGRGASMLVSVVRHVFI